LRVTLITGGKRVGDAVTDVPVEDLEGQRLERGGDDADYDRMAMQ
jgi:hypothetical protein